MISFDLKCAQAHVFEAWFRSSATYEDQRTAGLIFCPVCGDSDIAKAVMAPAVAAKGNQRAEGAARAQPMATTGEPMDETRMKAMLSALAEAQAKMLEQSEWVGNDFAERARAMHYGEAEHAPIHGTTDPDEARAMIEEGLAVAPLLVPVTPPDETH